MASCLIQREQPPIPTGTEDLTGTVRSIIWSSWDQPNQSPNFGVVIARLAPPPDGSGEGPTIKGPCPDDGIEVGLAYRFLGRWTEHRQYGKQFTFSTFTKSEPATRKDVIAYLVKLCPHVGKIKADQLWNRFQADAVRIVREDPEAVAAAQILTLAQARESAVELAKHAALEATKLDLFGLFDRRGFPSAIIAACISKWGAKAHQILRRNPFALMTARPRLPGAGFRRCDKLYCDLGKSQTALKRQMLCAWNMLREDGQGHTWISFPCVSEAIRKAIRESEARPREAIALGVRSKWLASLTDAKMETWIAEHQQAESEKTLAEHIRLLRRAPCLWTDAASDIVPSVLTPHQIDILRIALREPVAILSGTPGTGKTFTAAQVVKYLSCRFGPESIAICAPTGKAAVRMTAAMASYGLNLTATTIHSLLGITRNGHDGLGWAFLRNVHFPLNERFVLVDEVSMLDTNLAASLFSACAPGTHVLLIGDQFQLPPVGHGAPLRDMIAARIPNGQLTEIRRNSGMIVEACAQIKDGNAFETAPKYDAGAGLNLRHFPTDTPEESIEFLLAVTARFQSSQQFGDPIDNVQILVTLNAKSKVSRTALNRVLQNQLNPTGQTAPQNPFRIGDKIICTKNSGYSAVEYTLGAGGEDDPDAYHALGEEDYVANGDQGRVMAVAPKVFVARFACPDRIIKVRLGKVKGQDEGQDEGNDSGNGNGNDNGNDDSARAGTGCDFALAYAITCHKSQGSEWPCCIVMIDDSPGAKRLCSREHIYTAISRAKTSCVLIGKMEVLLQQCKKVSLTKRKTFLCELLTKTEGQ